MEVSEEQPYRPYELIDVVEVPKGIEVPQSEDEIVDVAKHIYLTPVTAPKKLPEKYAELERFFLKQYVRSYAGKGVDITPFSLDLLFQQFAVKKDEKLKRNGFNTFGLYALSYLKALETVPLDETDAYLGGLTYWGQRQRALLMGCSSLSSAEEFKTFVKTLNQTAIPIIADIDPLATKIAAEAGIKTIQADAQRIPLQDKSVDFIATNWLMVSLKDKLGSGKGAIIEVLREFSRILKHRDARLAMVDYLTKNDVDWILDYAFSIGLGSLIDKRKNHATIFNNREQLKEFYPRLKQDLAKIREGRIYPLSERFSGQKLPGVVLLVFNKYI